MEQVSHTQVYPGLNEMKDSYDFTQNKKYEINGYTHYKNNDDNKNYWSKTHIYFNKSPNKTNYVDISGSGSSVYLDRHYNFTLIGQYSTETGTGVLYAQHLNYSNGILNGMAHRNSYNITINKTTIKLENYSASGILGITGDMEEMKNDTL